MARFGCRVDMFDPTVNGTDLLAKHHPLQFFHPWGLAKKHMVMTGLKEYTDKFFSNIVSIKESMTN